MRFRYGHVTTVPLTARSDGSGLVWLCHCRNVGRVIVDVQLLIEARDAAASGRAARLRQVVGLSQSEFARAAGVSAAAVHRWEAGARRPSGDAAVAYARALRELARQVTGGSPLAVTNVEPAGNGLDGKAAGDDGAYVPTD